MPDSSDCSQMTPEWLERATDHGERPAFDRVSQVHPNQLTADPMADVHAAIRFLKWCQSNQKSTVLGEEWLIAAAKRLAQSPSRRRRHRAGIADRRAPERHFRERRAGWRAEVRRACPWR